MSKYKVMNRGWGRNDNREIFSFVVTNAPDNWDHGDRKWPYVAEFPVQPGYSEDDQHKRALEYANYMNSRPELPPIKINASN